VDYNTAFKMSHDDITVAALAQAGNSSTNSKSKNISNTKNISNSHTKQDMKMTKSPAQPVTKQEQALNSKSALRPTKQQQPRTSSKEALSSLPNNDTPNDTPVKTRRVARSGSDLSEHFEDTAKNPEYQQTPITTATADDESILENASTTINDLEQKIRQVHKLVKLAKRNTAKDQEAARRIARENEALENELSLPGKQTVEGLTAACAKARQKLLDTDQAIAELQARLKRVQAETDALAEQVSLVSEASTPVDASTTDTISTKVVDTIIAVTDSAGDDEDILAVHDDPDEVTMLVDQSTIDATSTSKVTDTSTAANNDEDEVEVKVEVDEVKVEVDEVKVEVEAEVEEDDDKSSSSKSDSDHADNEGIDIDIDDDSSSSSSSSSESDDESYQGFVIPLLPVYTPDDE
jgi:hypothetical protein